MTRTEFIELYEITKCLPTRSGTYLVLVEDDERLVWKTAQYTLSRQLFDTAHIVKWANLPEVE